MLTPDIVAFGFPFAIDPAGAIAADAGDAAIRGKIIQVLFTTPGERVNLPTFGCGLLNLVFEPDDSILAAALEFTIGQALARWLRDDIIVDGVDVAAQQETIAVEVAYTRRADLARRAVRIRFR